jgi:hypothetical protein
MCFNNKYPSDFIFFPISLYYYNELKDEIKFNSFEYMAPFTIENLGKHNDHMQHIG